MAVYLYQRQIVGTATTSPSELPNIKPGVWGTKDHSFGGLTECACPYLDRFSSHGNAIRDAYENAVVEVISIFSAAKKVNVAVVGSGGLLQEAVWLTKLYQKKDKPYELALHLIDPYYVQNHQCVLELVKYVQRIVPSGSTLDIYAWGSCKVIAAAAQKTKEFIPDLVIGMDMEKATASAQDYQWELMPGDIEKALLVRWEKTDALRFWIYSRRGSADELAFRVYAEGEAKEAAECIKKAAFVGV